MSTATDMALEYAHAGLPLEQSRPPVHLRAGELLEGGWVALSCGWNDEGLTRVMAARDDEGIGVIAEWRLRPDGTWRRWTVSTESGGPAAYRDHIPPAPPRRRG